MSIPCSNFSVHNKSLLRSNFSFPIAGNLCASALNGRFVVRARADSFSSRFCGLQYWILEKFKFQKLNSKIRRKNTFKKLEIKGNDEFSGHLEGFSSEGDSSDDSSAIPGTIEETSIPIPQNAEDTVPNSDPDATKDAVVTHMETPALVETNPIAFDGCYGGPSSLCIAVIGATGELARIKIFPALFALYYSGFLPENVCIFGYSRKDIRDDDLRSIIAATLTCRVDHQEECGDKMDAFLKRTYYINAGYNNKEGMAKLNARMAQNEGASEANRIFYLSVPQEALLDVALSLADNAQTQRGWNRIIVEKPFGFDAVSSHQLTQSLQAKFEEDQIYRIDHLLGKDLIENLSVLRFSNLVFEPLWSRTYIRSVQVILSEEWGTETRGRYFKGYGIIRDIVHSHIFQTIALFAMEPPVSLDGEDIRNEKVKVLRSIRKLELDDFVLGQYKGSSDDKEEVYLNSLTPTFFAAALYIENARWDGVPFLIKTGLGLIKHRVEIRIQFRHVPGNLYRERIGHDIDLTTNELILRGAPDEAILLKVNNKIPGLTLQMDASELNLLYKDKYNVEVPDSYEHLLLDVIDGDNHLFMRSDEVATAWNILSPVLREMDKGTIAPELYQVGGRGPVGAYYLGAKHGVRWADD